MQIKNVALETGPQDEYHVTLEDGKLAVWMGGTLLDVWDDDKFYLNPVRAAEWLFRACEGRPSNGDELRPYAKIIEFFQ